MNGINPNSLILGGMYNNQQIPPSPIGNLMNLSPGYNQGAMGNYYTPGSSYSNPYLEYQRKQKMEVQMKEEQRAQSGIWKKLSRNNNKATNRLSEEEIEEHVKKYDPIFENKTEKQQEEERYTRLVNLNTLYKQGYAGGPVLMNVASMNREIERVRAVVSDDTPLDECLAKVGGLFLNDHLTTQRYKEKDISKLYDQKGYGELVKMHSGASNYYNAILTKKTPVTTDDLEITLPSHFNTEYAEKKRQFIDSIFNKNAL